MHGQGKITCKGYESLCAEVADSISWRRFCRIPLDGRVPHPTTLMKLTSRCGEDAVAGLNEALWARVAQAKLLRTGRVRADITVIAPNVAYPTDSGLLAKAVGKLVRTVRRVQARAEPPASGLDRHCMSMTARIAPALARTPGHSTTSPTSDQRIGGAALPSGYACQEKAHP